MKFNRQRGVAQLVVVAVMAFLALGLPVVTKLVQQNQENRSQAASVCKCNNSAYGDAYSCSKNGYRWTCSETVTTSAKVCTPNTGKKCNDGKLYTCNSTGSGWKTPTNCATGACKSTTACSTVNSIGQKCASTYKNCTAAGVAWYCSGGKIAKKDCKANNQDCKNGACVAKPVATCSSTNCGNCGTLSACNANSSCVWSYSGNYCEKKVTCTSWKTGTWSRCSSGVSGIQTRTVTKTPSGCNFGTPANKPVASQECCSVDFKRCKGRTLEVCLGSESKGNTKWNLVENCINGCDPVWRECRDGDDICIPDDLYCQKNESTLWKCQGEWWQEINDCEHGCNKDGRSCNKVCLPGEMKCVNNKLRYKCNQDGTDYSIYVDTCQFGCTPEEYVTDDKTLCNFCKPGSLRCAGPNSEESCDYDGTKWILRECNNPGLCDTKLGQCVGENS